MTILHTLEPVPYNLDFTLHQTLTIGEKRKSICKADSKYYAQCLTSNRIRADQVLKAGLPTESVVGYATEHSYDLVIMGTH